MKKVYCVVPVFNRLEVTRRFLGYMAAQDYAALHVVIVNDGSTDGTSEFLTQNQMPNLTVLTGDGNLWWGGAMHMGIDYVSRNADPSDYLLMLNDDVQVEPGYVSALVADSVAHGGAVIGSRQCDEVSRVESGSGYHIDYWGMRMLPIVSGRVGLRVNALPGRGALFPMVAVLMAGNINVGVFRHYFGDIEYSARMQDLGWPIVIGDSATVYSSTCSSDEAVRNKGFFKEYFSFRSKNDLRQRLWFFSLRGPYWLRLWAIPRYALVGLYRKLGSGRWA